MHRVVFAVYPGFEILDVSGPSSAFNNANRALEVDGKPHFYEIGLVSGPGGSVTSSSGIAVDTHRIGKLSPEAVDTLLIAGAERDPLLQAMADPAMRGTLPQLSSKAGRF